MGQYDSRPRRATGERGVERLAAGLIPWGREHNRQDSRNTGEISRAESNRSLVGTTGRGHRGMFAPRHQRTYQKAVRHPGTILQTAKAVARDACHREVSALSGNLRAGIRWDERNTVRQRMPTAPDAGRSRGESRALRRTLCQPGREETQRRDNLQPHLENPGLAEKRRRDRNREHKELRLQDERKKAHRNSQLIIRNL